jgi:hypothetical protein
MLRLTSKPIIRLALLIAAVLILVALVYGLRVRVVGDRRGRDLTIVDGSVAAAAPTPVAALAPKGQ